MSTKPWVLLFLLYIFLFFIRGGGCGVFVSIFDAGGKCCSEVLALFEYSLPPAAVLMQPAAQPIAAATAAIGEVPRFCLVRYSRATQGLFGPAHRIKTGFWPEASIGSEDSMSSLTMSDMCTCSLAFGGWLTIRMATCMQESSKGQNRELREWPCCDSQ